MVASPPALVSADRRPSAARRGYNARWQRTRARTLSERATCEHEGCDLPATDVHHLDGLGPQGPRGHDPANLQALCHPHHSQVTAREQPGGWAKREPVRRATPRHPGLI